MSNYMPLRLVGTTPTLKAFLWVVGHLQAQRKPGRCTGESGRTLRGTLLADQLQPNGAWGLDLGETIYIYNYIHIHYLYIYI